MAKKIEFVYEGEPGLNKETTVFFDNLPCGITFLKPVYDSSGDLLNFSLTYLNKAFLNDLGSDNKDNVKELLYEILNNSPGLNDKCRKVLSDGQPAKLEGPIKIKDHIKNFDIYITRFNKNLSLSFHPVPDIKKDSENNTGQKNTEDALKKSEYTLKLILENINEGIIVAEAPDGKVTAISSWGINHTLGKSINAVINLPLEKYLELWDVRELKTGSKIHPEKLPIARALKGDVIHGEEWLMIRPDGSSFITSVNAIPIYNDEKSKVVSVVATWTDITESKRSQQALLESEEKFSKAFITNPNALVISRIEDGIITEVNETFLKLFEVSRSEIIGKTSISLNMFVNPEDRDRAISIIRKNKILRDFEVKIRTSSGEERTAVLSGEILDVSGGKSILTIIEDITERKKAEEELLEKATEIETVLNSIADGVFVYNKEGKIVGSNSAANDILNYQQSDHSLSMTERTSGYGIWTEDGRKLDTSELPAMRAVKNGETTKNAVLRIKGKGEPKWIIVSAAPILINSDLTGAVVSMSDITIRKEAEEKLRISEEMYKSVVETQQELIVKVDMEGRFTFINDAYCRKFGVIREDLIGKNTFKPLVYEDDLAHTLEKMKELEKAPFRTKIEQRAYTVEGVRWIEWDDNAILNEKGEIIEIQGVGRDIHDRKIAEEALKESKTQLLDAQKLASFGNYSIDMKNNNKIDWSDQMFDIWEVDRNKPLPRFEDLWNLIHPEDQDKVKNAFSRATIENDRIETEFRIIFPGNRIKYIYLISRGFFDEEGNLIKRQGVEIDITERKTVQIKLEEALKQIEERLKEKEVLLREIYHRTKNNLQLISSMINLKTSGITDEGVKCIIEDIQDRISAVALVHQKLYKGGNLSRINLKDYIINLGNLLLSGHSDSIHKIKFIYDLEDVFVVIDTAVPCGLIITELILNSIKHAFPGDQQGYIRIKLNKLEDNIIELIIADNGIGLKEADAWREDKLGLQLFKTIAEDQLDATIELNVTKGVTWILKFNDVLYKQRV